MTMTTLRRRSVRLRLTAHIEKIFVASHRLGLLSHPSPGSARETSKLTASMDELAQEGWGFLTGIARRRGRRFP
jgi:hypothetical protein